MAYNHHLHTTCLDLSISIPGFASSSSRGEGNNSMRNLDINKIPREDDVDEGSGGGEQEEMQEEEGECPTTANGGPPRKKLRLSKEQSRLLEESFRQHHTLNPKQKEGLALQLKLMPRQVEVWFQNRRARSKLKQTEMECDYLRRWFGSLTEQNRRLKKEVEDLRNLKVGPPTIMTPHSREPLPASTLTMCPRCERVSTTTTTVLSGSNSSATGRDNGGNNNSNNNNNNKNVTLSAKVQFLHSRQHPSAAY